MPANEEQLLEDDEPDSDPMSPLAKRRLTRSGTRLVEVIAKSQTKGKELENSSFGSDVRTPQTRRKVYSLSKGEELENSGFDSDVRTPQTRRKVYSLLLSGHPDF